MAEPGANPHRAKEVYNKEKRAQYNSTISSNLTDEVSLNTCTICHLLLFCHVAQSR